MHISFGEFVKRRRKFLNIQRQTDLASLTGLSKYTVTWIETGKANPARIKPKNIAALSEALVVGRDNLQLWAYSNLVPSDAPILGDQCTNALHIKAAKKIRSAVAVFRQYPGVVATLLDNDLSPDLADMLIATQEASPEPLSKETCSKLIKRHTWESEV